MNPLHRRREKAWPTLSTVGTRKAGRRAVPWPLPYETGDLLDAERRVLECLGAALVSEWNKYLPTDVQRRLFERAALGKSHDAALLKARVARVSLLFTKTIGLRAKVHCLLLDLGSPRAGRWGLLCLAKSRSA